MKLIQSVLGGACFLIGAFGSAVAAEPAPASAPAAEPRPTLTATKKDYWYFRAVSEAGKLASPEQTPEEQARADEAWRHLFDPVDGRSLEYVDSDGKPSSLMLGDTQRRQGDWTHDPKEYVWTERARLALRERGLKFCEDFPRDVRRYVWLFEVSKTAPFYWRDAEAGARALTEWMADRSRRGLSEIPLDYEAKARWELRYLRLRADFLAATVLDEPTKNALRLCELERRFTAELQRNRIPDTLTEAQVALRWAEFCKDFMDLAERYPAGPSGSTPAAMIHFLETEAKYYPSFYPLIKKSWVAAAKLSPSGELKDDAYLADIDPVELVIGQPVPGLKFTTLKNQAVDRKVWRGKVVLLDFWAFWCHSCIEAMPHLKTLYDKYHDQGFEIYGVCFAEKNETPQKIVDLMKKMEIPWEQSIRESLRNDRFGRLYNFTSLPQLMLLDKNGHLAAQNLYHMAEMEAKIQELLKQPAP